MPTKERSGEIIGTVDGARPGDDGISVVPEPLVIANVLVPLSAAAASERALPPAAALARRFGARLHLLTVGIERAESDAMAARHASLKDRFPSVLDLRVDWDVAESIMDVAREQAPSVVCMVSHARGRLGEVALGSYTSELLAGTPDPVLLVGFDHDAGRAPTDGPVFACVDGSLACERVLPVAASWASALGVDLRVVTVAEPTLSGLDDRPAHRIHGPDGDPLAYVEALADRWRRPDLVVTALVVDDPGGVAAGLASLLEHTPCGMLAITTHARTGLRRAVFGSQAASIVRHSPVPVLVVPPPHH